MNELLLSELRSENKNLLETIALIESFIFSSHSVSCVEVSEVIKESQKVLEDVEQHLDQAEALINELYVEQLFIDDEKEIWPSSAFQIQKSVANRMIAPPLKSIIIQEIINHCGFECDIVYIPEKAMIRIICDDVYAIIFDAVTGESLNGYQLDLKLEEVDDDPYKQNISVISRVDLITNYLTALKSSLIRESSFDNALKCVDLILLLHPDDPLERRDRGFLLHQLDCFKVAYDDYRYFVEQCPKDPAAQLLKLQLENIHVVETTLH